MENDTIKIAANAYQDGRIELITEFPGDDLRDNVMRQILDTREKAVRDALISLGWTPPEDQD